MPNLPYLQENTTYRELTDTFAGYNHNAKIADGEFYDSRNLTTLYYPLMANRKKRGVVKNLYSPGGIMDKVYLAYVDEGTLYLNGQPTTLKGLTPGEKQLVPFGAYICVFPDGKYYNTADSLDYGSMESTFNAAVLEKDAQGYSFLLYKPGSVAAGGFLDGWHYFETPEDTDDTYYAYVYFTPEEGAGIEAVKTEMAKFNVGDPIMLPAGLTDFEHIHYPNADPEAFPYSWFQKNACTILEKYTMDENNPEDYIVNMQNTDPKTGKGTKTGKYNPISRIYTVTYDADGETSEFVLPEKADFIKSVYGSGDISVPTWSYIQGTGKVIFTSAPAAGKNNITIAFSYTGLELSTTAGAFLVSVPKKTVGEDNTKTTMGTMRLPEMDFVVECKNRLWGCKYGVVNGENINEIYASALGDFKNWKRFEGISTDPYAASVGSDGPWTGAINYLGYPTFFKEDRIHRVAVSAIGAHEITEIVCDGVQPGSHKSLGVVNGMLYYKSNANVVIYQGGIAPTAISAPLGDVHYYDAVAGVIGDDYYISMRNTAGEWNLFCYDSKRNLWMREDDLHVIQFATVSEELYALTSDNLIIALRGTAGLLEDHVDWYGESGIMYYQYPDKKYVSRFNFRLQMEKGARIRVFIDYDSSGRWEKQGEIISDSLRTVTLPIRPRRCDHLRIRVEGRGDSKIFSIARILEIGSDY